MRLFEKEVFLKLIINLHNSYYTRIIYMNILTTIISLKVIQVNKINNIP